MIWATIIILSSWLLGTVAQLVLPQQYSEYITIAGMWGSTALQTTLWFWTFGWGYARARTWPRNTPESWNKYLRSIIHYSLLALTLGTFITFITQRFFTPTIDSPELFQTLLRPPPLPKWLHVFNIASLFIGLLYGAYTKTTRIRLMNFMSITTHKIFIPILSIATSLLIIGAHRTSTAQTIYDDTWTTFIILIIIAALYIGSTLILCKRYTEHSYKDLCALLISPLIVTRSYFLPPTAHTIAPFLPQCRQTSLFLHYNLTMEILCLPVVLTTAFLCYTAPDMRIVFFATPCMLIFRFFLPIQPLIGQAIGALTLSLWDMPLEYTCITIWTLSLCDIIINLAQIFTSYASLMFFLPPANRIGKPIPLFVNH